MVWKHTPVVNPRTVSVPQIPVLVCRSCFCSLIVPFLPVFYPASYLALETHAYLSAVLPVDLLPPYGSVFPFALGCRFSWSCPRRRTKNWLRKRKKKHGIFRRSRACHNSLLQPALSPRNPVLGVHIEGLAQPVALHNRLTQPVGHLRTLA